MHPNQPLPDMWDHMDRAQVIALSDKARVGDEVANEKWLELKEYVQRRLLEAYAEEV